MDLQSDMAYFYTQIDDSEGKTLSQQIQSVWFVGHQNPTYPILLKHQIPLVLRSDADYSNSIIC